MSSNKALLSFTSSTSIEVPKDKIIKELLLYIAVVINYQFEGEDVWHRSSGDEFIDSQTLKIIMVDDYNNIIQCENMPGVTRTKNDCDCDKCKRLPILENLLQPIPVNMNPNWHIEQKHDITDVIVIDDSEDEEIPFVKPTIIKRENGTSKPTTKKRVKWAPQLETIIDDDNKPSTSTQQCKKEYRRSLRCQTLRRSERLAEKRE